MKFILVPIGSAGDVFPYIGLAESLAKRGHDVKMLINGYFAHLLQRHNVAFEEVTPAHEFLNISRDPRVWRPIRGPLAVFKYAAGLIEPIYNAICDMGDPADTILVSSCLGWGARMAQDRHGYPGVTIDLQPAAIWSAYRPPRLPGVSRQAPLWWNRSVLQVGQKFLLDPICCPQINAVRRRLKLTPIRHVLDWCHSSECIIGMFPSWYADRPPDWPDHLHLTQFPLWDADQARELPEPVETFLNEGEPPIVVTPGSANPGATRFFDVAIAACQLVRRRALLVSRFEDQLPIRLPANVTRVDYVSFTKLLPRAAAIVHHGGIGTTARALACGVPRLIHPFSHDQPDNAKRVRDLGVGEEVFRRDHSAQRWASKFKRLLESDLVSDKCRQIAGRFNSTDAFSCTCRVLEAFAARVPSAHNSCHREAANHSG